MSEALPYSVGLAQEGLDLQMRFRQRLVESGRDRVATPSIGGMGPYSLSGTLGTRITIGAETYQKDELASYAELRVRVNEGLHYIVQIRNGQVGNIVDQDGEIVRDMIVIDYLIAQIACARESRRVRMADTVLKIVGKFTK